MNCIRSLCIISNCIFCVDHIIIVQLARSDLISMLCVLLECSVCA